MPGTYQLTDSGTWLAGNSAGSVTAVTPRAARVDGDAGGMADGLAEAVKIVVKRVVHDLVRSRGRSGGPARIDSRDLVPQPGLPGRPPYRGRVSPWRPRRSCPLSSTVRSAHRSSGAPHTRGPRGATPFHEVPGALGGARDALHVGDERRPGQRVWRHWAAGHGKSVRRSATRDASLTGARTGTAPARPTALLSPGKWIWKPSKCSTKPKRSFCGRRSQYRSPEMVLVGSMSVRNGTSPGLFHPYSPIMNACPAAATRAARWSEASRC